MKFTKTGRLRFLSHLDLMALFQRAAARANVPVGFSQGFNPHPKIAFGPALSVGVESVAEYLDMETSKYVDPQELAKALNSVLPKGIGILESRVVSPKAASLSGGIGKYAYQVEVPRLSPDEVEGLVKALLSRESLIVSKEGKQKDIRPCIESIAVASKDGRAALEIILVDQDQLKPRIQDVLDQLFTVNIEERHLFSIKRTGLYCGEKGRWVSPMEV